MWARAATVGAALLLALAALAAVLAAALSHRPRETFQTTKDAQVMSSNPWNIEPAPRNVKYFPPSLWPTLLQFAPLAPPTLGPVALLCDPIDAAKSYPGARQRPAATGYFMLVASAAKPPAALQLPWVGRTIGYTDRGELFLILSLLLAYQVPLDVVRLRLVDHQGAGLAAALEEVDFVVVYVVRDTPFYNKLRRMTAFVSGFYAAGVGRVADLADRVRVSYAHVKGEQLPMREWWSRAEAGLPATPAGLTMSAVDMEGGEVFAMTQTWVDLQPAPETFLVPYRWDAEALDPRFECVGGAPNASKAECDSANDVLGLPKRRATVWDRPCESSDDCDGAADCNDGYCDLPAGVTRASYRKAASGAPICAGCTDPWDPTCCQGVQVTYVYPTSVGAVDLTSVADAIIARG